MFDFRKNKLIGFLILVLILGLVGCSGEVIEPDNINIEDKYISLSPSTTEVLFALGLGDNIVGVTEYCNYPEEALDKDKVGGYSDVNLEKVLELEPNIVFYADNISPKDRQLIEKAGIETFDFKSETVQEVLTEILEVGKITEKEKESQEIVDEINMGIKNIEEKTKGLEKPKVFYEIWHDPLQTVGKGSFLDDIIDVAGGYNIARNIEDINSAYIIVQNEFVIQENPEFYFLGEDTGLDLMDIKSRVGYDSIDAVENSNVYFLDPDIMLRPGPRVLEALETVSHIIYSDIYQ